MKTPAAEAFETYIRELVTAVVDARAADLTRPERLSQRTVERWTSLPARDYLKAARAGAFPVRKVGRLVMSETADVVEWLDSHEVRRRDKPDDEWSEALASVGARRVDSPEDVERKMMEKMGVRWVKKP